MPPILYLYVFSRELASHWNVQPDTTKYCSYMYMYITNSIFCVSLMWKSLCSLCALGFTMAQCAISNAYLLCKTALMYLIHTCMY